MHLSKRACALLIAATQLIGASASAQQMAVASGQPICPSEEPDSLQISWTKPCDEGDWLLDTRTGCRMWDWHPAPEDRAVWKGACPSGKKEGRGAVQWYEHGRPIDRFEGTFRNGKREGFGRYVWTSEVSYDGHYANGVPDGFGIATLFGETFSGTWRNGCFTKGSRVVAIGVERASCSASTQVEPAGKAGF
jgi:hypothetical protein